MIKTYINGIEESLINVRDRGFQYGDGIFETIAYKNNKLELWHEHMQRLQLGCERLSLKKVEPSLWLADFKKLNISADAVIKICISRGISSRGYAYNSQHEITRVISASSWPDYPLENSRGITAIFCKTPVSMNAALAGLKHLNRLDNVLARNEWNNSDIAEGLMLDNQGHIVEGTMSNVFCVLGDELYTPSLAQSGVAGIMRQQVIELAKKLKLSVNVVDINKENFLQMDALFITNSIIGIWPIKKIIDENISLSFKKNKILINLIDNLELI